MSRILACAPESLIGKRMHKAPPPEAAQVLQTYKERMLTHPGDAVSARARHAKRTRAARCTVLGGSRRSCSGNSRMRSRRQMAPGGDYESIQAIRREAPGARGPPGRDYCRLPGPQLHRAQPRRFLRGIRSPPTTRPKRNASPGCRLGRPPALLLPHRNYSTGSCTTGTKPTVSARDIYTYGPSAIRDRETTLSLAEDPGRARLAQSPQDPPARHDGMADCSEAEPMSIRDFIARALNTPSTATASIAADRDGDHSTPIVWTPSTSSWKQAAASRSHRARHVLENGAPFHWDIESRSAAELGKGKEGVGARAYAEHPSTEVLCVSFARGNGPVETWVPGQPIPEVVLAAAADPSCPWVAHNAAFERAMLECILIPRHGWPMVPVDRHVCTMSLALAHAYPGSLDGVAKILGLVNQKDVAREKIVRVMWKPRKPRRGEDPTKTLLGRYAGTASRAVYLQQARRRGRARAASASASCGRYRRRSRTRGCSTPRSTIAECASTRRWPRQRPGSRRRPSPT